MKKIGNTSFTESGYNKFVSLTRKQQVKRLQGNGSFLSDAQAEKLLKGIPNGDIGSGNDKQATGAPTGNTGGGGRPDTAKPAS